MDFLKHYKIAIFVAGITMLCILMILFNYMRIKMGFYELTGNASQMISTVEMSQKNPEGRNFKIAIRAISKSKIEENQVFLSSIFSRLSPDLQEMALTQLMKNGVVLENNRGLIDAIIGASLEDEELGETYRNYLGSLTPGKLEEDLIRFFGENPSLTLETIKSLTKVLNLSPVTKLKKMIFSSLGLLELVRDNPKEKDLGEIIRFIEPDTFQSTLKSEIGPAQIPMKDLSAWVKVMDRYGVIEEDKAKKFNNLYTPIEKSALEVEDLQKQKDELLSQVAQIDELVDKKYQDVKEIEEEISLLNEKLQGDLLEKRNRLLFALSTRMYLVSDLGNNHYEIALQMWDQYSGMSYFSNPTVVLKSTVANYYPRDSQSMILHHLGTYGNTGRSYYEEISHTEMKKLPQLEEEYLSLEIEKEDLHKKRKEILAEIPELKIKEGYEDLQSKIYTLGQDQAALSQVFASVGKDLRSIIGLEMVSGESFKVGDLAPPISKEQIIQLLKDADNVKYNMTNGYADDHNLGNVEGYYQLRSELSTHEKIREYMKPYWSEAYIESRIEDLKQRGYYKEVGGVLYSIIGDPPLGYDYKKATILEVKDLENEKEVTLDVPDPYGGNSIMTVQYRLIFTGTHWVLKDEGTDLEERAPVR